MRCSVIMPQAWRGGMLNFAILIANTISEMNLSDEPIQVSLCVPFGFDDPSFGNLRKGIGLVHFETIPFTKTDYRLNFINDSIDLHDTPWETYSYPQAINQAMDLVLSDFWFVMTGRFEHGPLLPLKPLITYAPDFIQRIVPEINGVDPFSLPWMVNSWQNKTLQFSDAVICTTSRTATDAVSYAGVPKSRVHRLPMVNLPLFDVDENDESLANRKDTVQQVSQSDSHSNGTPKIDLEAEYFLWPTNTTQHKNHRRAVVALKQYYEKHGGKFRCVMCGAGTDFFNSEAGYYHPYVEEIKLLISNSALEDHLQIVGQVNASEYKELLSKAKFLWHNVLYDNGTFSVIEAARLNTRSLVAHYPQMREICDQFGINANYFDPWNISHTASALKLMEDNIGIEGSSATFQADYNPNEQFANELESIIIDVTSNTRGIELCTQ